MGGEGEVDGEFAAAFGVQWQHVGAHGVGAVEGGGHGGVGEDAAPDDGVEVGDGVGQERAAGGGAVAQRPDGEPCCCGDTTEGDVADAVGEEDIPGGFGDVGGAFAVVDQLGHPVTVPVGGTLVLSWWHRWATKEGLA